MEAYSYINGAIVSHINLLDIAGLELEHWSQIYNAPLGTALLLLFTHLSHLVRPGFYTHLSHLVQQWKAEAKIVFNVMMAMCVLSSFIEHVLGQLVWTSNCNSPRGEVNESAAEWVPSCPCPPSIGSGSWCCHPSAHHGYARLKLGARVLLISQSSLLLSVSLDGLYILWVLVFGS